VDPTEKPPPPTPPSPGAVAAAVAVVGGGGCDAAGEDDADDAPGAGADAPTLDAPINAFSKYDLPVRYTPGQDEDTRAREGTRGGVV